MSNGLSLFCQYCGAPLVDAREGCATCGNLIPVKPFASNTDAINCANCDIPNHKDAKFCFKCGVRMGRKRRNEREISSSVGGIEEKIVEAINKRKGNAKMSILVDKSKLNISIWGPQSSGKTVYLISLYLRASQAEADWKISLEDAAFEDQDHFDQLADNLLNGDWPDPNPPEENREPDFYNLVFYPSGNKKNNQIQNDIKEKDLLQIFWEKFTDSSETQSKKDGNEKKAGISLSFADVAGERYITENPQSILWNHLAGCSGLICVIDPGDIRNQFRTFRRLGNLLKRKVKEENPSSLRNNGQYLPHRVAVCFSKMDRPKWRKYLEMDPEESPDMLIASIEKEYKFNIATILETFFDPERLTYHMISSVGLNAIENQIDGLDDSERVANKIQPFSIEPVNIFSPLDDYLISRE